MDKKELLMEYNTRDIIRFIVEDSGVEYDYAMKEFYDSKVFEKLRDAETGLYLESPAYVYGLYQDERNFGEIGRAHV